VDSRLAELRHLLPIIPGRYLLLGEGSEVLAEALKAAPAGTMQQVEVLTSGFPDAFLSLVGKPARAALTSLPLQEITVCILLARGGVGRAQKKQLAALGFNSLKCYRLAPSVDEVRWIIPAASPRVAAASLALYQPSLIRARCQKTIARILSRIGFIRLWARDMAIVAARQAALQSPATDLTSFLEGFWGHPVEVALFTGTPGYYRKPTAQVMDRTGRVLAFAKVGVNDQTKALLGNENFILRRLQALQPGHFLVPPVLYYGAVAGNDLLVVESAKQASGRGPHTLGAAHRNFLAEVWHKTREERDFSSSPGWHELTGRYDRVASHLTSDWRQRFRAALAILEGRSRDLGPSRFHSLEYLPTGKPPGGF